MTAARTICTRALRRLGVIDALHSPSAADMSITLDALNDLFASWRAQGVDVLETIDFDLDDTVVFFVPPKGDPIADLDYAGTWNASTNSPTLTSGSGTEGTVYKVSTAGSTELDDVTSWSANDYAVFDGLAWVKGKDSARHEPALVTLLAMGIVDEFGIEPSRNLQRDAGVAWFAVMSDYVKPPEATFDTALISTQTSRLTGILE